GSGVAVADKDHVHHRLMRLGHGHRRSVAILWMWTGLLSLFVLYPVYTKEGDAIVPFGVGAFALLWLACSVPRRQRLRREDAASASRRNRRSDAKAPGPGDSGPTEPTRSPETDAIDDPADRNGGFVRKHEGP